MNAPTPASVIDLRSARENLERVGGGRKIAYSSPTVEVRVEVFASPGPGNLRVEDTDVVYLALEGSGVLGTEYNGMLTLVPGEATVVPARTKHVLFGNPKLTLLVVSTPGWTSYGEIRSAI
jgi:mannose-6-phosphate isomerase-like protein (cupin superfamily)